MSETLQACVGEKIKAARKELSISYEQFSDMLKITKEKIICIENDEYKNNRLDVYYKGYIKSICKNLNLDAESIFLELNQKGINTNTQTPIFNKNKPMALKKTIQIKPKSLFLSIACLILAITIINSSNSIIDNNKKDNTHKRLSFQDIEQKHK